MGLSSESDELLRELNWKHHRKKDKVFNRENVALELADMTKYILCLWQHFGFTLDEMLEYTHLKSEAMEQMQRQEFDQLQSEPVPTLVSDIDGTLANYRDGFLRWCIDQGILPEGSVDSEETLHVDIDLALPYEKYRAAKDRFEVEGGYRYLEAYRDGIDLIRSALTEGWRVIVLTARPTHYKRVWVDTWSWLKHWEIQPNYLLMADINRVIVIAHILGEGTCPVILLEDNPEIALRSKDIVPTVVRAKPYNECLMEKDGILRVEKFPREIQTLTSRISAPKD